MRVLAFVVVLVLALASFGCGFGPVGADDMELTYETDEAPKPAPFAEDLRARIVRRLSAGRVGADVALVDKRVTIVVDEESAPAVDELVSWSGALLVHAVADGDVRPTEGSRAEIRRLVAGVPLGAAREGNVTLAEPLWDSAKGSSAPRFRTRIVRASPIGELGEGAVVSWGDGGTLRVRALPGTAAEQTINAAKSHAGAVVIARGRRSLGVPRIEADALTLTFGDGFESYSRAQDEKSLVASPALPRLRRASAVGLPPNNTLATLCFVLPFLLSLSWLVFVRRFDRAHPEPMWLVLLTFVLGALSTFVAGVVELLLTRATPWLDPRLVAFGGRAFALPLAFAVFTLVAGVVEEGTKLLAATFAVRRREFDEPVDGILYGIVASLGFAAAENVQYFASDRLHAQVVIARTFMSVPAHMFFGAIWGYALGARLVDPKKRVWLWFFAAAAVHGLFDALLSAEGGAVPAILLNVGCASAFVVLVRRALRHGVVDPEMLTIRPEERHLFRVGRPGLFWLSAVAVHLLAFGLVLLGGVYQLARHTPSVSFVVGSSVMLALLALAAWGVSAALPLDVAVDAYGVTFAGAARPWRRIRSFAIVGRHIELACDPGPLLLGPADDAELSALAAALRERLGRSAAERVATLESIELPDDRLPP